MHDQDENSSGKRYSVRTGINGVANIFKEYEVDIPVYEGNVQLLHLADVQPSYVLKGDIKRRGDLFISLKDGGMMPEWEKDDLVLLKQVREEELVVGDWYYLLLKDGREITGVLTEVTDFLVITPKNVEYEQVRVKKEGVVNIYKVAEGLKKEDALKEREKNK